jgi:hypothetical protein
MIQEANLHWRYIDTETNLILPWYTLPALQWLLSQNVKKWDVFEYGSGYSTIWWRTNCECVNSVDHNEDWANAMGAFICVKKADYIMLVDLIDKRISNKRAFDCVVVDGEWRDDCVKYAKEHVLPGGYMIIDNYGQTDFPSAELIDKLLEGWEKQVFKQPNHTEWATAVFKKP